jgi:hypothetical protein
MGQCTDREEVGCSLATAGRFPRLDRGQSINCFPNLTNQSICRFASGSLRVDYRAQTMTAGDTTMKKGDTLTIDGSTGQVLAGKVPMREPELAGEFDTLMKWADAVRKLKVRANADTPADARAAIKFGAKS